MHEDVYDLLGLWRIAEQGNNGCRAEPRDHLICFLMR